MPAAPLLAFCSPPPATGSPLLAAIRLALDLCARADQVDQWWDYRPHREARWHLDEGERAEAQAAYEARRAALIGSR